MSELVPVSKIEKRIDTIRGMIDQLVTNCDRFGKRDVRASWWCC